MSKKKVSKAGGAKKAPKRRTKRVTVKLRSVRATIERGIRTLQAGVDRGYADKATLQKARKRIKRLTNAVRELRAECPDEILDPRFDL